MTPPTDSKLFHWPLACGIPPLTADTVLVFAWDLDAALQSEDWQILSDEEADRARRFTFPRDRDRYVRAHAMMRSLLAEYSGTSPAEISLTHGQYGKPRIQFANPSAEVLLHFNLSHSGGLATLALACSDSVGIDIERVRPIGQDIAEYHFSQSERDTLNHLPPEHWLSGFYRCWTAKESLLKGLGLGLNLPLDTFDVEADPRRASALLGWRPLAKAVEGWQLLELNPAPGFVGSLAIQRNGGQPFTTDQLRCYSLDALPR